MDWQEGWCTLAKKTAKKTTKKSSTKKTTKKSSSSAVKKKTTKQPAAKKAAKKTTKKVAKKVTKKTAKPAAKKTSKKITKKVTKKITKATTKKVTKKVTKKTVKKPAEKSKATASKKAPSKKVVSKKAPVKKANSAKAPAQPTKADPKATNEADKKAPVKKFRSKARKRVPADYAPPPRPLLLGPGSSLSGGPLITSSKRPKKAKTESKVSKRTKTPFTPKQLDEYKLILLKKRAELVGDVQHLEDEALRSNTGETQTASNAAEFGTESFEQGLNLDLAAADRNLIIEIDDALSRINDRTYGLCIESHEPIKKERLEELPWAKYSIASARKLDNHFTR